MIPFYTITWDFNRKEVHYYDIMPYLIDRYNEEKNAKSHYWGGDWQKSYPQTKEEIKEFILGCSMYQWWARCEYEVIVQQWPQHEDCEQKIDVHEQVKANIEAVLEIFMSNIG